jgi:hypothetical protein
MKLTLTVVPTDQTVIIDVAPAVYNRAMAGTVHFQDVILDLARTQLPGAVHDLRWNEIAIDQPASVG